MAKVLDLHNTHTYSRSGILRAAVPLFIKFRRGVRAHVHALTADEMVFLGDETVIPARDPTAILLRLSPGIFAENIDTIGIYANRLTPANVPLAISAVHERHY